MDVKLGGRVAGGVLSVLLVAMGPRVASAEDTVEVQKLTYTRIYENVTSEDLATRADEAEAPVRLASHRWGYRYGHPFRRSSGFGLRIGIGYPYRSSGFYYARPWYRRQFGYYRPWYDRYSFYRPYVYQSYLYRPYVYRPYYSLYTRPYVSAITPYYYGSTYVAGYRPYVYRFAPPAYSYYGTYGYCCAPY